MKRRKYSGETKFKAVLAVIKGEKSTVQAGAELGCHPTAIGEWRDKLINNGAKAFETPRDTKEKDKKIAEYERLIGKLTVQTEFLKKVSESAGSL
jgi:transposase